MLIAEHVDGKKKRRPRVDPNKLDLHNLTGEENISVINRETGKKVGHNNENNNYNNDNDNNSSNNYNYNNNNNNNNDNNNNK